MESDKHVQDLMRSITASLAIFKRFLLTNTIRPFIQGENFTDWCNSVLNPYCQTHYALQYLIHLHEQGSLRYARSKDPNALTYLEGVDKRLRPAALNFQATHQATDTSTSSTGIPAGFNDLMKITEDIIHRELAPIMEGVKNINENVRAEKIEKGELKKDNAALLKANQATSEEFQETVRQFVKELQYPLSVIYDLRWNRHLSQEKIVVECSRLKLANCRTKKRVGELLAEIIGKAKAKGYMLSDRITGPGAPPDLPIGYDEATDGKAIIETSTSAIILEKDEMDSLVNSYRKVSPAEQSTMREHYGPEFVKELKRRAIMPEKNRKPNRTS